MNELYKIIEDLCRASGITITEMCRRADVPRGNLTDLKNGRQNGLSTKNLGKIASYFSVSTDYLLGKEDKKISASPAEPNKAELISMIQNMSQEEAARMLAMAKVMFGGE